jgi:aromatic ring-opening dioxygenase LigB subunit
MITFGAIAPHGDVEDIPELLAAMEELGRRCTPDTAIVVTPHNVHVEGHFAVATAAHIGKHAIDRELAHAIIDAARADGLPILGVSYGGNVPEQSELPLDWGTEVPLDHIEAKQVVVVAPARDRPLDEHVRLGASIARATGDRDVALIASADHGHTHAADGPYGYDPAAAEYDTLFQELLVRQPLDFKPLGKLVEAAKADSLWQLLVLQGAIQGDAELLTYVTRSYYGMAVAIVA